MIPFVDLLMVTVAFLLITAVWAQSARLDTDASVPGDSREQIVPQGVSAVLHVRSTEESYVLSWRHADTVISETRIARSARPAGVALQTPPELVSAIRAEWERHGRHRDPSDKRKDRAVLHVDDRAPFAEIAGLLDAIAATRRGSASGSQEAAFDTSFAVR